MDPHKILNIPYSISVLLIRDLKHMELIRRPEDIITGEAHSFGQLTPFFGSRNFMSLKLYFLIKNLGVNGLEEVIERRCHMATVVSSKLTKIDRLLQINDKVDLNSVIFMYFPREIRTQLPDLHSTEATHAIISVMNEINVGIQEKLFSAGDVWLHTFLIPDLSNALKLTIRAEIRPLRFMSGNPILGEQYISHMLRRVVIEGDELLRKCIKNMKATDPIRKILSSCQFHADVNETNKLRNGNELHGDVDKGFSIRNNIASVTAADSNYLTREEFCKRKTELLLEIRRFCSTEFNQSNESYFVVIYGSYGYGLAKPKSDLDIVFYCQDERCTADRQERVIAFVHGLHRKYKMQIDNEIPYEYKILLPYSFLWSACQGDGIITTTSDSDNCGNAGQWFIPKILKSMEYLTSRQLLLRFFMGVFSNPNFFVCGNVGMYNKCKGLAKRNLVRAIMSINGRRMVTSEILAKDFCSSPRGEFGDYFLGLSEREPFTSHLLESLEVTLSSMYLKNCLDNNGTMAYVIQSADDLKPERFNDIGR